MKVLAMALAMAVSFPCMAQSSYQMSPEVCQGFARERLMDTKNYMSSEFNYQQHHEMVCRNTQRDTDTKFGLASSFSAIVNFVPMQGAGSMDFSKKKSYVDEYCKHIESMSQDEKKVAFSSQQFSDNMRDTTNACLDVVKDVLLQRGGIFAYASPNNTQLTEFLVSVEVRPNPQVDIDLTGYSGSDTTCTFQGKPLEPMKLNLNGPTLFLCRKPQDEGTYLTLHTSKMADFAVRLPGQEDKKILAMQSQMDSLSNLVAQQANRQVELADCDYPTGSPYTFVGVAWGVEGITNMWNNLDQKMQVDCPTGQVMIGVQSGHFNPAEDRQFRYKCCTVRLK